MLESESEIQAGITSKLSFAPDILPDTTEKSNYHATECSGGLIPVITNNIGCDKFRTKVNAIKRNAIMAGGPKRIKRLCPSNREVNPAISICQT